MRGMRACKRWLVLLTLLGPLWSVDLTAQVTDQRQSKVAVLNIAGRRYQGQRTRGQQLWLSPNESFFNGKGIRATGRGDAALPGADLNKAKMFRQLEGLGPKNSVSWYLHLPKPGPLEILVGSTAAESKFQYHLGEAKGWVVAGGQRATLQLSKAGLVRLRLQAEKTGASLSHVVLRGAVLQGASLLRARWRPQAAHTRFTASTLQGHSRVWVMEMAAMPGEAGFYAPMTTPFGYFGASWDLQGRPTGLNFSMWSYGRGKSEPPIEKLSHLIALGDPKASFGGFGHEGTGVKPRNTNPFTGWRQPAAVFALRLVPGRDYDTYYGYYFDPEKLAWRLYAAGRKAIGRRRVDHLWAGSFVEVPGPPQRQRTGHIRRTMSYRGFTMDASGTWHAFDRMRGEGKPGQWVNRGRGLTKDGRFALWMGGMQHFGPNAEVRQNQPASAKDLVWMQPKRLRAIFTVPTEIWIDAIAYSQGQAQLTVRCAGLPREAKVEVFYGDKPGRTFAKHWARSQRLTGIVNGKQVLRFPCKKAPIAARILVKHAQGQFWSL